MFCTKYALNKKKNRTFAPNNIYALNKKKNRTFAPNNI